MATVLPAVFKQNVDQNNVGESLIAITTNGTYTLTHTFNVTDGDPASTPPITSLVRFSYVAVDSGVKTPRYRAVSIASGQPDNPVWLPYIPVARTQFSLLATSLFPQELKSEYAASATDTSPSTVVSSASISSMLSTSAVSSPSTTGSSSSLSSSSTGQSSASASNVSNTSKARTISTGAVAGIGIGCAIAGALIVLLALLFLSHRKRNRRGLDYSPAPVFEPKTTSTSPSTLDRSEPQFAATPRFSNVDNHLPQPVADQDISGGLSALRTQISNHVLSFYNMLPGQPPPLDAVRQALGNSQNLDMAQLQSLLARPSTRTTAMKFILARIIITRIEISSNPTETLLSPSVLSAYQSISQNDMKSPTRTAYLSRWRSMTCAAISQPNTFALSDEQSDHIRTAMVKAEGVLKLYAKTDSNRQQNLEEVMKRGARLGQLLFSQPSVFEFDWGDTAEDELVVFPGLLQVTDEAGAALEAPRSFGEKEVARL